MKLTNCCQSGLFSEKLFQLYPLAVAKIVHCLLQACLMKRCLTNFIFLKMYWLLLFLILNSSFFQPVRVCIFITYKITKSTDSKQFFPQQYKYFFYIRLLQYNSTVYFRLFSRISLMWTMLKGIAQVIVSVQYAGGIGSQYVQVSNNYCIWIDGCIHMRLNCYSWFIYEVNW